MIHRHLQRQLRKLALDAATPPDARQWGELVAAISRTYDDADRERYTLERSITLSSREMQELNERLMFERDQFAQLFRYAPAGMVRIELDGRLSDLNAAFTRTVAHERGELLGRPLWALALAEEEPAVRALVGPLFVGEASSAQGTLRFRRKASEVVVAKVGMALVRGGRGEPLFVIAVVEDVTERNHLEVQLRHAQKLESVGRLAAGVAHEINTPIQFVGDNIAFVGAGFADLLGLCDAYRTRLFELGGDASPADGADSLSMLEDRVDLPYLREHVPRAIDSTVDGVKRVATIVQAMKTFAHPDRGQRGHTDLNAALQSTLTVAYNELRHVADVEIDLGELPPVPCYLGDLNQVFLNLLVNAAHAVADTVASSGKRGTIRVQSRQEGAHVLVAISDTGTGIPEDIRDRIFDPFFTTKEVGRGTGQGLALARAVVVDKHGGTLTFDTRLGRGTTFYVRLPLLEIVSERGPASEAAVARG